MRAIGTIREEERARRFGLYLHALGIENQVEEGPEGGFVVWVVPEDRVAEARDRLARFRENPDDPAYARAASEARALLEEAARREAAARKREVPIRSRWAMQAAGAAAPVTLALILASTAVFLAMKTGSADAVREALSITRFEVAGAYIQWRPGLPEIFHGEVWRLFTPALIHFGFLHILLNLLWLKDLGSLVERRYGRLHFALMTAVIAALSNLGQYLASGPSFGGMSGVVFGLLGFVWIRGRFDPSAGFHLPRFIVLMMGAWYLSCVLGIVPGIANTAHTVGLAAGMAWGYLSSGHLKRILGSRF